MKVRRDIASIPVRSASETWQAIIDLISGSGSVDTDSLTRAASIMEAVIADEHPSSVPIVVKGNGPRLVIYLHYNEAAMEAGREIDTLTFNPTGGSGWSMTAPCEAADVAWMNNSLKSRAARITIHDVAVPLADEDNESAATAALAIDWGVLTR